LQIADRFHILCNLTQAIQRYPSEQPRN
jgi:hypothetical protein